MEKQSFLTELTSLINRHSIENNSNTPDHILANFMWECLQSFEKASISREKWYGKGLSISGDVDLSNS